MTKTTPQRNTHYSLTPSQLTSIKQIRAIVKRRKVLKRNTLTPKKLIFSASQQEINEMKRLNTLYNQARVHGYYGSFTPNDNVTILLLN